METSKVAKVGARSGSNPPPCLCKQMATEFANRSSGCGLAACKFCFVLIGIYSSRTPKSCESFGFLERFLHNPQQRIRRETMNESEFQNIIAQQIIKCIGAKHSLPPCITWESALLLPTLAQRNSNDSQQQPEPGVSQRTLGGGEGSGQLVTHPLLPYPHTATSLLYRFPARL